MYVNKPMKNKKKKSNKKFRWWRIPLMIIALLLVAVIVYVAYVFISYNRIEDNKEIAPQGTAASDTVKLNTEYTALTYNVGFGAYTPDFTFFMDGGKSSWAKSKESVIACIDGAAGVIKEHNADFALLQEVDFDSTRSYHVDERKLLTEQFTGYSSTFAQNYHSAFLFYPFLQPHGANNSGLLTLSNSKITSSVRRSLPISTGIKKILDLDRCYSINRIPVENGKELVILNLHTSAYGTDGDLQTQQMQMLFDDMIPEGFSRVTDYATGLKPSTRNTDVAYGDDSFVATLDGFIVSDNIETTYAQVVDTGFAYSDHNPVEMKFFLKG